MIVVVGVGVSGVITSQSNIAENENVSHWAEDVGVTLGQVSPKILEFKSGQLLVELDDPNKIASPP